MSPAAAFPPEAFERLLEAQAVALGLPCPPPLRAALARYLGELDVWRRRTNLTGRLSAEDLAFHAVESLLGGALTPGSARVVDIGSGAGFPGIPLALARPDLAVTALEPRRKRADFLRHVVSAVPVGNVTVRQARADELEPASFDVATVRAVGRLPEIIDGAPFLISGGFLLAWTTEPETLAAVLSTTFESESVLPVRGTERRVIARLRRR